MISNASVNQVPAAASMPAPAKLDPRLNCGGPEKKSKQPLESSNGNETPKKTSAMRNGSNAPPDSHLNGDKAQQQAPAYLNGMLLGGVGPRRPKDRPHVPPQNRPKGSNPRPYDCPLPSSHAASFPNNILRNSSKGPADRKSLIDIGYDAIPKSNANGKPSLTPSKPPVPTPTVPQSSRPNAPQDTGPIQQTLYQHTAAPISPQGRRRQRHRRSRSRSSFDSLFDEEHSKMRSKEDGKVAEEKPLRLGNSMLGPPRRDVSGAGGNFGGGGTGTAPIAPMLHTLGNTPSKKHGK